MNKKLAQASAWASFDIVYEHRLRHNDPNLQRKEVIINEQSLARNEVSS